MSIQIPELLWRTNVKVCRAPLNSFIIQFLQVVDGDLEKDAKSLAGRDGWILKHDFIKYSIGTELCKDDPHDKVRYLFYKTYGVV